jgi:hypothetical protein
VSCLGDTLSVNNLYVDSAMSVGGPGPFGSSVSVFGSVTGGSFLSVLSAAGDARMSGELTVSGNIRGGSPDQ